MTDSDKCVKKGSDVIPIDYYTKVEVHLGVDVGSAQGFWGPDNIKIRDLGKSVQWPANTNYPRGVTWMTIQTRTLNDGRVPIGDPLAVAMFDKNHPTSLKASNGVLLLKVVSEFCDAKNYFCVPARYANPNFPSDHSVYNLDRLDDRNKTGYAVYTVPVHGLKEGQRKFFFVVILKPVPGSESKLNVVIQKISVSRGRNYFRVQQTDFYHDHFQVEGFLKKVMSVPNLKDFDWPTIYELYNKSSNCNKIHAVTS